nr:ATP-binding protein [Pelagibaculum spongiae]
MEVNFELDGKVPADVRQEWGYTTVLGIKGANGSGKTNILKALNCLNNFCLNSADVAADKSIQIDTFYRSKEPTDFSIEFEINQLRYFYELSLQNGLVVTENLHRKKMGGKKTLVLTREEKKITTAIKDLSELKQIKLRSDASIICQAKKFEFQNNMIDIENCYKFFKLMFMNVNNAGYFDFARDISRTSKLYHEGSKLFIFIKRIIKLADSSIRDIEIRTRTDDRDELIYYPVFIHKIDGKDLALRFNEESSGTQTLYKKMAIYWATLEGGALLAIDEFDIHLHAMVLPSIVDLFLSPETNPKGAQFLFTAHNTEIIDYLGKYRTLLVNKEDSESYGYRLDELPANLVRNNRPISPIYLAGKIGGIPTNIPESYKVTEKVAEKEGQYRGEE